MLLRNESIFIKLKDHERHQTATTILMKVSKSKKSSHLSFDESFSSF